MEEGFGGDRIFKQGVDLRTMNLIIPQKIVDKIMSGEMRRLHGLETGVGSLYLRLRSEGASDLDAQYRVYKSRGLI